MSASRNEFKYNHFKGELILWAVRWYCQLALFACSLTEYSAMDIISLYAHDRYNSKGKRLLTLRAILRQDRANSP